MLLICCFFFFFQAEDGIRDHCVTGVQTCALPILQRDNEYVFAAFALDLSPSMSLGGSIRKALDPDRPQQAAVDGVLDFRSEERRVGKECRSRGAAYN